MPQNMSTMFRRFEKNCSSFRKAESVPCSNTELNAAETPTKIPESCLSPTNYKWKSVNSVTKVKRGKSATNIDKRDSQENILNIREQYSVLNGNPNSSKFTKQYLKMKFSKIFRSNSKMNRSSTTKSAKEKSEPICRSCNSTKSQSTLPNDMLNSIDGSNDALRNLSFTAAMMSKSSQLLNISPDNNEYVDHTTVIPSSTLRFWRKPSEEKLKASQRRNLENIHGSSEVLLRINPTMDTKKHPSELSLFYDDGPGQSDLMRISNNDIRSPGIVQGYDKALNRYQNILNQSKHISRKKKTLSLAYETELNTGSNRVEMRPSQSSNNMSDLTRSLSVAHCLNPDMRRSLANDDYRSPFQRGKSLNKDISEQNPIKLSQISPPSYDNSLLNKRFVKMKIYNPKPNLIKCDPEASVISRNYDNTLIQKPPKPPPRSDSLIRSFELICKNLRTSISEPRGDSFKIFKSQRDYENWLKNLPYNNPDEIAALLKMRSKIARRQCVSELIDFHVVNTEDEKRRRHSWPLPTSANLSFETVSDRRTSSLSRVKKKKEIENSAKSFDSPSLCNYSRLYSLRNSDPRKLFGSSLQSQGQSSAQISQRSPLSSTVRNRRPFRYRYRHTNSFNPSMTESCHESGSNSVI